MAREGGQQRQHEQEQQRKAGVFHGDDREDGDDAAGVRRHGDNARGEERLDRVDVAEKARGDRAGVLRGERGSGQARQLGRELRAQRVGHLLPEHLKERLLSRGENALERERAEVGERRRENERRTAAERVDDTAEQQRRQEGSEHRGCRAEDGPGAQKLVRCRGAAHGSRDAILRVTLHVRHLLSGSHRARGTPERTREALRACRRWSCRLP